jgi:hypothetical protein
MIGPSNSFMYNNPSWTINGSALLIIGIIIIIANIFLKFVIPAMKKAQG